MEVLPFEGLEETRIKGRENRFTILTEKGRAHLHDPGRLLELIFPGNRVLVLPKAGQRKTQWDVIAAWFKSYWVFVHSGYHNIIAQKIIPLLGLGRVKEREVKVDHSRIDFRLEDGRLLEVKGCTLLKDGVALFPDAPTERGRRHVELLEKYGGVVLFLVMHPIAKVVAVNREADPRFWEVVGRAEKVAFVGVRFGFEVEGNVGRLVYKGKIPFIKEF